MWLIVYTQRKGWIPSLFQEEHSRVSQNHCFSRLVSWLLPEILSPCSDCSAPMFLSPKHFVWSIFRIRNIWSKKRVKFLIFELLRKHPYIIKNRDSGINNRLVWIPSHIFLLSGGKVKSVNWGKEWSWGKRRKKLVVLLPEKEVYS